MSAEQKAAAGGPVDLQAIGQRARAAACILAGLDSQRKNSLLLDISGAIVDALPQIIAANAEDLDAAQASGMSESLMDRLLLDEKRLQGIAADVRSIASLPDPVGTVMDGRELDSGLFLMRRRVPLGVVAAVYEARPNVTVDISALCLKTGNAVILRGGKETLHSNAALTRVIEICLERAGLPAEAVQHINSPDRALLTELLHLDAYVDMLIPRGGEGLQRLCREESRIPVITGGIGVCHIFVDKKVDADKALKVVENAKMQRPSACNAVETLLLHADIAAAFLPRLIARLVPLGATLHLDAAAAALLGPNCPQGTMPVQKGDYDKEWLSYDFNVRVVTDLEEAVAHIRTHGTAHSEAVLTEDLAVATRFVNEVDAAAVYVNASTRFTDGGQFGLGAEVAISTQKLHARGPMGPDTLTTWKWIAYGDYTIRE
ncbi:MAG: glutamate-5-semialdehyde dehydrogenase [Desulfovibrio sp.]|nr:glutamate-5-semialdehyde dehydrogenase [Desulfovibrio sp.]